MTSSPYKYVRSIVLLMIRPSGVALNGKKALLFTVHMSIAAKLVFFNTKTRVEIIRGENVIIVKT